MRNKLTALPHFFTISNIFLGFMAILYVFRESFTTAAWCIIIATLFDMLDGMIARATGAYSRFGVELDSLADAISFGVAPAYLIYYSNFGNVGAWGIIFSFLYLLTAVLRLARFNTQAQIYPKKRFKGLPSPVGALAVTTFLIFSKEVFGTVDVVTAYLVLVPGLSLLMVSNIQYEKVPRLVVTRSMKRNWKPLVYMVGFLCILFYPRHAFFPWIMVYILHGILNHYITHMRASRETTEISIDEEQIIK